VGARKGPLLLWVEKYCCYEHFLGMFKSKLENVLRIYIVWRAVNRDDLAVYAFYPFNQLKKKGTVPNGQVNLYY
jgi:hypothetical protein